MYREIAEQIFWIYYTFLTIGSSVSKLVYVYVCVYMYRKHNHAQYSAFHLEATTMLLLFSDFDDLTELL
jgi:hypothetical protein